MTATGFFTKSDFIKPGTYKAREGYTRNAWSGSKWNEYKGTKDLAQKLREFIKADKDLNACKWSIKTDRGGFTQSITVALMAAPFQVTAQEWGELHGFKYHQHANCKEAMTHEGFALVTKIRDFLTSYNYDDSDVMADYFDRGFYDWYHVGKWDKPFQVIEPRKKDNEERTTEKKNRDGVDLPAVVPARANIEGVQLVEYSDKAFAIVGNTKEIKDTLKTLGGRFNARLTCGAGWIFSNSKRVAVRSALAI